ncbi:2-dehydropantoate 2-reductase [Parafrankia irregularis]|uniref:2-dehydropantoate 2-reductase n=1 Tax=Parafrankia irregularis TaxID=795642 RepID=A0A0S4QYJ5_9ACTN|nr:MULTISPECIES: 2-dehydropantoate 2-reductase N-terminal domain-containing protein [Parafrankia]MBE3200434.1 ketopantoate reductase family protein [Parafrankia sp. CH37]CUU60704.1 2-dehydropantoate 2-reductase [Parafrankia irregularis]
MTRYIIIGAGAVGAMLAAQLTEAGIDHVLVGRGEHIRRIREDGLRYVQHGEPRTVRVSTASDPDEVDLRGGDLLVLATKVQDAEAAVRTWAWRPVDLDGGPGVAAELPLLTLQNGLDADRIALRRFARVLGGTILTSAHYHNVGEVRSGARDAIGVLTVGGAPRGTDPALEGVAADLRRAGYIVQLTDDVTRWKAAKLLHSVRNGLEVLAGDDDEERSALGQRLVAEARAVFEAAGLSVADTAAERTEDLSTFGIDPNSGVVSGRQSTWQSFARGVPSEADFLNGEIVLLGRLHGVPTPVNAALQRVLGEADARRLSPGTRTLREVTELAAFPART